MTTTSPLPSKKRGRDSTPSSCDFVNFVVGGRNFSIRSSLIAEYPDSYFSSALKKEWRNVDNEAVSINRDGSLFEYIVDFHNFGMLPQRKVPLPLEIIKAIQEEADFYNMAKMVKECDTYLIQQIDRHNCGVPETCFIILNMWENEERPTLPLTVAFQEIWSPACFTNYYVPTEADAQTIHDTLTRNIVDLALTAPRAEHYECACIDAAQLDQRTCTIIRSRFFNLDHLFSANRLVYLKQSWLLIVSKDECIGDMLGQSTETNFSGTLLYILNTDFEGGELTVTHNSKSLMISKQYQFMFIAKDCPYQHNKVRSGTQVLFAVSMFFGREKDCFEIMEHSGRDEYLWNEAVPVTEDSQFVSHRMLAGIARPLSAGDQAKIFTELTKELMDCDAVTVCLTHYYPILQCTPELLSGGDCVLYGVLSSYLQTEEGSKLEMTMTLVNIEYHINMDSECCCAANAAEQDLSFGSNRGQNGKLIIPKLCTSDAQLKTKNYTSNCEPLGPVEATEHLLLGLKIAKKTR